MKDCLNNLIGKNIFRYNYYTCKYSMINKYGLTSQEYMNHMNKKDNIIYIKGWSLSDINKKKEDGLLTTFFLSLYTTLLRFEKSVEVF